jgi:hypothetical protein
MEITSGEAGSSTLTWRVPLVTPPSAAADGNSHPSVTSGRTRNSRPPAG